MSALNRQLVRDEVADGLRTALTGDLLPVSSVYGYQKGSLKGESPVVLVLSGPIQRTPNGLGAKKYDNDIRLEIHVLIYDGNDNQPIPDEKEREDKGDEIEAKIADWFSDHQIGTNYRSVVYTPEPTEKTRITYLDGNPYWIEVIPVLFEKAD